MLLNNLGKGKMEEESISTEKKKYMTYLQNTSASTNELSNLPLNDCTDDSQKPELMPK